MNRQSYTFTALLAAGVLVLGSMDAAHAQRSRTRTGARGGTSVVNQQVQNTGNGGYIRNGGRTYTSPTGQSRSTQSSGQGQWTGGQGQGAQNSYQGQVTTGKGNTYSVDHNADYQYDQATGLTRNGSTSVTNSAGETVGTSTSSSSAGAGQGRQRTTTTTGPSGNSSITNVSDSYDPETGRTRSVNRD